MADQLSLAQADALARDLKDRLSVRFQPSASGVNSIRQANDANGYPELFLSHGGNEAEGQPVILVRIQGVNAISVDVFGNPIIAAAPLLAGMAYELNSSSAPIPAPADLATANYEIQKMACQFELIQIANGTAVTEASFNAATPLVKLDDLYWPTHGV